MKKPVKKAIKTKAPLAKRPVSKASARPLKASTKRATVSPKKAPVKVALKKAVPAASKKTTAPLKKQKPVSAKTDSKKAVPAKQGATKTVSTKAGSTKAVAKTIASKRAPGQAIASKGRAMKGAVVKKTTQVSSRALSKPVARPAVKTAKPTHKIPAKASGQKSSPAKALQNPLTPTQVVAASGATPSVPANQGSAPFARPAVVAPRIDKSKPYKIARAIPRSITIKEQKPAVQKTQAPSAAPDLLEKDVGADPGFFQKDEVFDETDYAQHLQLMEQADISRRAREMNRPQTHPDFDGEHCLECDIQIPQARLVAGRIRCVDCQEEVENEERRTQNLSKGRGI